MNHESNPETKPKIILGADHGGFADKRKLVARLLTLGHKVIDAGTHSEDAADYPIFAYRVAEAISRGDAELGLLLCRSGNGMAMAANQVPGVRAAIATSETLARVAREHNDANVLVLGSDYLDDSAEAIVDSFLEARPHDGRHARRLNMIKKHSEDAASDMAMHQLIAQGQSPWLDDISDMIIKGDLQKMIDEMGLRGLTSNPSIFEKAITSGEGRYRAELAEMKTSGTSAADAYEKLTTDDIAAAADLLRPVFDETGGDDGFVSLEVLPSLAAEEEKTISEAVRLFEKLARPNVMIKVPGTTAGIRAFRRLTAAGVNVNVTLIFSRVGYNEIARAYIAGLKDRQEAGGDITKIRSVASVFVSRIDSDVSKRLAPLREAESDAGKLAGLDALEHKTAIANTRLIYADFKEIFHGSEFEALAAAGASVQRPLWGSTSTKDASLSDVLYVEELIGPQTVNTIPTKTYMAFLDHGRVRGNTIEEDLPGAARQIEQLGAAGIDIEDVCADLQVAGVKSFSDAFDTLFAAIQAALA